VTDSLFSAAFMLLGGAVTGLEVVAFALALLMVLGNIRQKLWAWPLAIVSSLLYFALFWRSKLYGDAALQVFFAVLAGWGWAQWWRGLRPDGGHLCVSRLTLRQVQHCLVAIALLWPLTGLFLQRFTDTDVPWWDAFPTATSLIGQYLLARKYIENWLVWMVVNLVSIGLFAYKGLWLTVLLYALFTVLSLWGWRVWHRLLRQP
jgi:nicotinamide mononucleotide transporter